jgi:hypothetical protein
MPEQIKVTDWIVAISSVVSAATIVAIAVQVILSARQNRLLSTQLTADHERSRRENAVNLLFQWGQLLDIRTSVARRIAEALDDEQARLLWSGDSLKLPSNLLVLVQICLEGRADSEERGLTIEKDGLILKGRALREMKWSVVRYLNLLEAVFTSRRYNTADHDIIDEQFGYLVSNDGRKDVLGSIRKAAGGPTALPAIEEFVRNQRDIANALKQGKPPILRATNP